MAVIPQGGGGGGSGGSGWIRIVDVATQDGGGSVTDKVWQDAPNTTVLQSCTVSHLAITVTVKASYPTVTIGGVPHTLDEDVGGGYYEGNINATVTAGDVSVQLTTPDNAVGAQDSITIAHTAPPEITALSFSGGYPGVQTELGAGDTFTLVGTTDVAANAIDIQNFGAMVSSLETFTEGLSFSVVGTIADQGTTVQALSARVRARAASGSYGSIRDTNLGGGGVDGTDLVNLNNTYPTAILGAITYPASQQALKASEQATVAVTLANADTVLFESPNGDLSIGNPGVIEALKTVERIAGSYNVATTNLRVTANRAANNRTTVDNLVVYIASVAASISMSLAARLRSGGNDGTSVQSHTITLQSDQNLIAAPSLDAEAGGGTFSGSWATGPANWTRSLAVDDDDVKGNYDFANLSATNLAGIVTTVMTGSTQYVLGGFVARTMTFAAFVATVEINVAVSSFSDLDAGIFPSAGNATAVLQPIGTAPTDVSGREGWWTIDSLGINPTTIEWLHTPSVGANSTGTATITDVEEAI